MCKKQNVTEKERWRIVKKLFQNAVISIVLITFPSRFANAEKNILRQYMIADLYVLTTKNITGTENKIRINTRVFLLNTFSVISP